MAAAIFGFFTTGRQFLISFRIRRYIAGIVTCIGNGRFDIFSSGAVPEIGYFTGLFFVIYFCRQNAIFPGKIFLNFILALFALYSRNGDDNGLHRAFAHGLLGLAENKKATK